MGNIPVTQIAPLIRQQRRPPHKFPTIALLSTTAIAPPDKPLRKPAKKRKRKVSRAKARARGRELRLEQRRKFFLDLRKLPDFAVLTLAEWQAVNTLSERQARRILASDDGPVVVWLSAKRRGITVKANREWLESRPTSRPILKRRPRSA
jgi:hypothetical protein